MAQLRDLIVNGASRFLGVVMFNNQAHFNDISNFNNNVIFNKDLTLSTDSTLTLLNTTAAKHNEYSSPALVIGSPDGAHIEIDTSGIMAKTTNTTSTLKLNSSGGIVAIGGDGLSSDGIVTITKGDVADSAGNGALQITGGLYSSLNSYFASTIEVNGGVKAYNTSIMYSINPATTTTYNLGSTDKRWNYLYTNYLNVNSTSTFNGKITANAGINITTTGLDVDAGGINIDAGGLTIRGGAINASDGNAIHTIAGKVQITQGDAASSTTATGALQVTGGIRVSNASYFASSIEIDGALNVDNTATMRKIIPETKNIYDLGESGNRWNYLYAQYLNVSSTSTLTGAVTAGNGITITAGGLAVTAGGLTVTAGDTVISNGKLQVNNTETINEIKGSLIVGNGDNDEVLTVKNGIGAQYYYINDKSDNNKTYFVYNSTDDSVDLIFI